MMEENTIQDNSKWDYVIPEVVGNVGEEAGAGGEIRMPTE